MMKCQYAPLNLSITAERKQKNRYLIKFFKQFFWAVLPLITGVHSIRQTKKWLKRERELNNMQKRPLTRTEVGKLLLTWSAP